MYTNAKVSRRRMLAGATALATGGPLSAASVAPASPRRALRIAFITDIHLKPEGPAVEGFTACLRRAQSLKDKPDVFFCGGDAIFDCFAEGKERTKVQWDLWQKMLKAESSLPMECCIGNHDIWGGNRQRSGTTGKEALYGRKWAMDVYGLATPYRSFDRAGWRFIFLDDIFLVEQGQSGQAAVSFGYHGRLDEEQFAWLEGELQAVPTETPVCIVSHIPMLSVAAFFCGATGNEKLHNDDGNWVIPSAWVHTDAKRMKDLFARHPNVKLCLSGHLHLHDRVQYNGVSHVCNGAVCGAWWKGPLRECPEGYGLIDLYDDGSFAVLYLDYGWTAPR